MAEAAHASGSGHQVVAAAAIAGTPLPAKQRLDMAHSLAHPSELPTLSRHPSLAAALQEIDVDGPSDGSVIRIGTRPSALALVQANLVRDGLVALEEQQQDGEDDDDDDDHDAENGHGKTSGLTYKLAPMTTAGDRNTKEPLYMMGGKALWTKDLEVALLSGAVDCIVHSFKDVPTTLPEGCEIAAVLKREDPRDALVVKKGRPYKTLDELPPGSCVGSSSVRRVAQLRRNFPQLTFKDCRGNIDTRLRKLDAEGGPFDALILASAGLLRMQQDARITSYISAPVMLHATGQGAIGIEIRSSDSRMRALVSRLTHLDTWWRTSCERALLRTLEGGCSVPVGVETRFLPNPCPAFKVLELSAVIVSLDGQTCVEHKETRNVRNVDEAEDLGIDVAQVLIQKGGKEILEELGRIVSQKNVQGINDEAAMKEKRRHEPAVPFQQPPTPARQQSDYFQQA